MVMLTADAERRLALDLMASVGATPDEAEAVADVIVEADLRGHDSHGLARAAMQLDLIRDGHIQTGGRPHIERDSGAAVAMNGDRAPGPYAINLAMDAAVERAREHGTCTVTVHNHGYGAYFGRYAERATERDCIGILLGKSRGSVHPYGGNRALIGTNPLTIAIPTEGDPVLVDMSTAASSNGKILAAVRAGVAIPPDWAVDEHGAPTIDPAAARKGALSPLGGPKGYALGLAIELLAGVLAGAAPGLMIYPDGRRTLWGTVVIALHVPAFMEVERFRRDASAFLAEVKNSPLAPGFSEILIPGERAYRLRLERLQNGIPFDDENWANVVKLCDSAGLDANAYAVDQR